jgi:putative SOS response-associated peptidase YedK
MCGRYEAGQKQKIAEAFHVSVMLDDLYFGEGLECAPGSIQPVIYMNDGERQVGEMRWGFKLPDRLLFNARSDSVTTSPFWRERLSNRCIIPASSFFEWQKTAPEPRPKYRLTAKGGNVLGMAGIWGPWQNPKTGQWEPTFAVITTDPNTKMSAIHNRQPVILEPREYAEWLEESERPPVHLLRILPDEDMTVTEMDAPTKPEKVEPPKKEEPPPAQSSLFA